MSLSSFTDVFAEEIAESQPLSLSSNSNKSITKLETGKVDPKAVILRPAKHTGQYGELRSVDEIDKKYRAVFSYPFFNLVQSKIIEDALYSDKSMVVCAPTGSGKTVVFEMAIVQLLMEMEDKNYTDDFKIIYMAPVKAVCTERLTEWYPKFTKLGLLCIEVTGDTDVDFSQLKPYRIIITTPEKWDLVTRRAGCGAGAGQSSLARLVRLFLVDEVHVLQDEQRGPVLEAVVSRMKAIEASCQSAYRIEQLQKQYNENSLNDNESKNDLAPRIRFVAVSATVSNPEDVAEWLGTGHKKAVYHKFGDECRPVKLRRIVEGYPCSENTSIFKFDIILNYKLWPIIQKYYDGKPTLIFCNTRKSVMMTAETIAKEITVNFSPEQRAKLAAIASSIKNKKIQTLILNGVGCHHAGLLYEERVTVEQAFRQRDLPILVTTTTLAMGVNLPAHLVIIKNTQQYVNGGYQEYSISTVLQMVGRAGRPQFDTEATAVIMTRSQDKQRYQSLVGGSEPLESFLHKRLTENLNSEAALNTVTDVAQCVEWLRSTFLYVRAAKEPRKYLGLPNGAPSHLIMKKIEELCVKAMNGLATAGLITMDEACCIESTTAGKLMSVYYLDFETMKLIMKIEGSASREQILQLVCESHELSEQHLRADERRLLNALNRNAAAPCIRYPMKGKITTRQMKLYCIIQAVLGCLPIPDPYLNQEAMKIMRIADRVCKCLVAYVTRPELITQQPQCFLAILNSIVLAKCISSHLWEDSPYVSKQMKGIGPTFSTLLATSGKVNFRLLEESHPRDLERIMNKGPPAGNVLLKQILLLPKYEITMTPVDEKSVTVKLMLLNQHYLDENKDNLTAGENHKCYIIIGDSENNLLHLSTFKDKDLIMMYDGCITCTITRKVQFEHKILAHCVSSTFAGIDVQNDYTFKNLDPQIPNTNTNIKINDSTLKTKTMKKQTSIKDTFKERKRKSNDLDISQSKEKKKRDHNILEQFRYLKKSFSSVANEVGMDMNKCAEINHNTLKETTNKGIVEKEVDASMRNDFNDIACTSKFNVNIRNHVPEPEIIDEDYEVDDEKFDSIMKEIESEINKNNEKDLTLPETYVGGPMQVSKQVNAYQHEEQPQKPNNTKNPKFDTNRLETNKVQRQRYSKNKPDNYKFIDILENNNDFNNTQENTTNQETGFSEAIKNEIQKFLQKAQANVSTKDSVMEQLLASQNDSQKKLVAELNECNEIDFKERKEGILWLDKKNNECSENNIFLVETLTNPTENNMAEKNISNDIKLKEIDDMKEDSYFCNTTSSMLPDVILVHGHDISNSKSQHMTKDASNYTLENELTPKPIEIKHEDDKNSYRLKETKDHKTKMDLQTIALYENVPPIQESKMHLNDEVQNNIDTQKNYEEPKVLDNNAVISNNKIKNEFDFDYKCGLIDPLSNDVIMLADESRDDYNNISKDLREISLTDFADHPLHSQGIGANSTETKSPFIAETHESNLILSSTNKSIPFKYKSLPSTSGKAISAIIEPKSPLTTKTHESNLIFSSYKKPSPSEACKYKPLPSTSEAIASEPVVDMEYTKKFSYTQTNIDICTKKSDSKKFTLKTIKKLKIDLDITQIFAVEHNGPKPDQNIREVICPNFNASYNHNDSVTKTPVFQRKSLQNPNKNGIALNQSFSSERPSPFTSALAFSKVPVIKSLPVYRDEKQTNVENKMSMVSTNDRSLKPAEKEKNKGNKLQSQVTRLKYDSAPQSTDSYFLISSDRRPEEGSHLQKMGSVQPNFAAVRNDSGDKNNSKIEKLADNKLPVNKDNSKLQQRGSNKFNDTISSTLSVDATMEGPETKMHKNITSIKTSTDNEFPAIRNNFDSGIKPSLYHKSNNVNISESVPQAIENSSKCTATSKKSSLDTILQKYAKILKEKTPSPYVVPDLQQPKESKQQIKPKRPFKIKDIQNIEAQIPAKIMEDIRPHTPPVIENVRESYHEIEPEPEIEVIPSDHMEPEHATSDALPEIEKIDYPDVIENEVNISQVDNSMFNPKMLLEQYYQSENDEEEYIPPPPQFCDNELYSPTQDFCNEIDRSENDFKYSEVDDSICNDNYYNNRGNTDSPKIDAPMANNPQSKPETWTLSHEDRIESNYPSDYLYNSQHNRSNVNISSFSQVNSRTTRLAQYKFGKNKFSARKKY